MVTVLAAERISKSFAGVRVLQDIDFTLNHGEVHALAGANGAGKSTLIKTICGIHIPDTGRILIENEMSSYVTPQGAVEAGISAVYQEFSLVRHLSVAENIFLGRLPTYRLGCLSKKRLFEDAKQILARLQCSISPRARVGSLSVPERQLVEIAKALSQSAKVLILDEPTAALPEHDVQSLFRVVRGLAEQGIGIIYVSHRLDELPQISDRVTVFRDGQRISTRSIADTSKSDIIKDMVGRDVEVSHEPGQKPGRELLRLDGLSANDAFENIDLTVNAGEVVGLTGLAGAGRTELAQAVFGLRTLRSGGVYVNGVRRDPRKPRDAIKMGLGYVTEDRKEEGLLLAASVEANLSLTVLQNLCKRWRILDPSRERGLARSLISQLDIKCTSPRQAAQSLSGGNQQKIVIGKWLATKPSVLVMDEPTRGVDIGAKAQIYGELRALARQGLGVLMISSDIPEVLQLSDRVIVMAAGHKTFDGRNADLTQEKILHYATTDHRSVA